jgi:uncharacterized membrane protein
MLLYGLGLATTWVLGRRLIASFESIIEVIPFVDTIYRSTKKILTIAGQRQKVNAGSCLINFPSPEMKAVGLTTGTLRKPATGQELAAVYVPTSPNPTSGYIEIVRVQDITYTDWSFDEAMAFIITGGTTAPDTIRFARNPMT